MNKLKMGDRVKVIEGLYKGKVVKVVRADHPHSQNIIPTIRGELQNGIMHYFCISDLELLQPSLDTLFVGDLVFDEDGVRVCVLGVCGEVIFLSADNHIYIGYSTTITEMKKDGYKLKNSDTLHLPKDTAPMCFRGTKGCEACNWRESEIGYYSPCPEHDEEEKTTPTIEIKGKKTITQAILDKILYIGEKIPEAVANDNRLKFVVLGTPQELIDETNETK